MTTGKLIWLDNTIVKWVAYLVNILVKIAGKIAPKHHDLTEPFKTIAVCKFKGLGSIVQATPLLRSLRARYPDAKIIFVSSVANKAILENIRIIDEIVLLNDTSPGKLLLGIIPFIRKLFRERIQVYIDLEVYSNFSGIVTAFTNAQNRLGYYLKESHYKMGIYTHMMYYNGSAPVFQTYLQWARLLQCKEIITELYEFNSAITDLSIDGQGFDLTSQPYIVVNPNASDLRVERRWNPERYIELISELMSMKPGSKILLIGSASEREYVAEIATSFNKTDQVLNIAGKTSIEELIAVIANSDLVITNDSGPMHLAFAMNVKTVALFGPCSPAQYGYGKNVVVLYKNVYCSPCVHEFRIPPCRGNNQCMQQITTAEVVKAVQDILNTGTVNTSEIYQRQYTFQQPSADTVLGIMTRKSI